MTVDAYEFGRIVVDGREFSSDLVIYPDRVDSSWWRQQGHRLDLDDLPEVCADPPDVLVIGTGHDGCMDVPGDVRDYFGARGVDLRVSRTAEATREFNGLQQSGRRVVAALHLTC